MTSEKKRQRNSSGRTTSRRRFVAATACGAAGAIAGCSDVTTQEFEADPVVLPEDARDELTMAEIVRDSATTTRQVDQVDGEVTITNQVAAYARGPARGRPTLMEKFLGRVNGTEGAGPGAVAAASDVGVDELTLTSLEERPTVAGDQVSLVVPAGAREGEAMLADVMVLVPGGALDANQTHYAVNQTHFATRSPEFLPAPGGDSAGGGETWTTYESSSWLTGSSDRNADAPSDLRVVGALGESTPEEVFGVAAEEMPGERIEEGESLQPFNPFLLAGPGAVADWPTPDNFQSIVASGAPAPLAGATYGMGVLATPNASAAGQSANPLTAMAFEDLLTHDAAGGMLRQAGVTDAADVEWLMGPTEVGDVPDGTEFAGVTMLGESAKTGTFSGAVSGENHPWFVLVNVARAAPDDVVVAAGVQRTSLTPGEEGTLDTGNNPFLTPGEEGTLDTGNNPFVRWFANGAEFSTAVDGALEIP